MSDMAFRWTLIMGLLAIFWLLAVWSYCMAAKQDLLEQQRDRLDYDPGCDAFNLRGSGRDGRDG